MARKKKTEPEECEYTEEEQRKIKELADSIGVCLDGYPFDITIEALCLIMGFCLAHSHIKKGHVLNFMKDMNELILQHAMAASIVLLDENGVLH